MNDLAKYLFLLLIFVAVCFTGKTAFGATDPVNATCDVECTVAGQVEWASNFDNIVISESLTEQDDIITSDGESDAVLYTNGDVTLTTTGAAVAQLTEDAAPDDLLETSYQITYDGDGATATGGATTGFVDFTTFIKTTVGTPSDITHFSEDGAVEVHLWVKASFDTGNVANAGTYSATQVIIATW